MPLCFDIRQAVIALYQEYRPHRQLAPLVECAWARSASATGFIRVIPDGCVDLFVSSRGEAMVAGPATAFYDLREMRPGLHG